MSEERQNGLVQIRPAGEQAGSIQGNPHPVAPNSGATRVGQPQRVAGGGDVCPSHAGQEAHERLELVEVRAKLEAAKGPQYWRCLEELAGSEGFEEMLHREFPRQASEWIGGEVSRRNFLKVMSAS